MWSMVNTQAVSRKVSNFLLPLAEIKERLKTLLVHPHRPWIAVDGVSSAQIHHWLQRVGIWTRPSERLELCVHPVGFLVLVWWKASDTTNLYMIANTTQGAGVSCEAISWLSLPLCDYSGVEILNATTNPTPLRDRPDFVVPITRWILSTHPNAPVNWDISVQRDGSICAEQITDRSVPSQLVLEDPDAATWGLGAAKLFRYLALSHHPDPIFSVEVLKAQYISIQLPASAHARVAWLREASKPSSLLPSAGPRV